MELKEDGNNLLPILVHLGALDFKEKMDPLHKKKPGTLVPGFEFFRPCFSTWETHLSCFEYLCLWVDSEEAATDAAVLSMPHSLDSFHGLQDSHNQLGCTGHPK